MARFLVVDDDPSTVRGMTQLLLADGHTVAPFTAGADAVGALAHEPFDVVVTDLEMPVVDGYEVVRAAHARLPEACVVVTTASAKASRDALIGAGANMVADKPFDYDELMYAIAKCLAH